MIYNMYPTLGRTCKETSVLNIHIELEETWSFFLGVELVQYAWYNASVGFARVGSRRKGFIKMTGSGLW